VISIVVDHGRSYCTAAAKKFAPDAELVIEE
jgi:hypothetical protein